VTETLLPPEGPGEDATAATYVATLEDLTGLLLEEASLTQLLEAILELTSRAVSACAAVSVTVIADDGGYTTAAATSDDACAVDALQYELEEGPCVDALQTGEEHLLTDLTDHQRWPRFVERATSLGFGTVLAVPLLARGVPIGALNVFAEGPDGLGEDDLVLARRIAAPAATTLANARAYRRAVRLASQLEGALETRAAIEQAKGVLMATQRCGPEEAFALLRRTSQTQNRPLREIAGRIVAHASNAANMPGEG
jgi:GAF domain-containing protein